MLYNVLKLIVFFSLYLWVVSESSTCDRQISLDIAFVLDDTASMQKDALNLKQGIAKLLVKLEDRFPETRYAVVTFTDEDHGCRTGTGMRYWCPRVEQTLTSNRSLLEDAFNKYDPTAGDSQSRADALGGLLVAINHSSMGWRPIQEGLIKVAVVVTDAPYRFPGDFPRSCLPTDRALQPNSGNGNYDCRVEDYPSVAQMSVLVNSEQVLPLFLVRPHQVDIYTDLIRGLDGFGRYNLKEEDSLNIDKAIAESIEDIVCPPPPVTKHGMAPVVVGVAGSVLGVALIVGGGAYMYSCKDVPDTSERLVASDDLSKPFDDTEIMAPLLDED